MEFIDGKMSDSRGYVMYRSYPDGVHVLMGSYTEKQHRGKGVFKTQLNRVLTEKVKTGETVQIALTNKKILQYLLDLGFEKIDEPVRHWGNISNGVNLKMIKK